MARKHNQKDGEGRSLALCNQQSEEASPRTFSLCSGRRKRATMIGNLRQLIRQRGFCKPPSRHHSDENNSSRTLSSRGSDDDLDDDEHEQIMAAAAAFMKEEPDHHNPYEALKKILFEHGFCDPESYKRRRNSKFDDAISCCGNKPPTSTIFVSEDNDDESGEAVSFYDDSSEDYQDSPVLIEFDDESTSSGSSSGRNKAEQLLLVEMVEHLLVVFTLVFLTVLVMRLLNMNVTVHISPKGDSVLGAKEDAMTSVCAAVAQEKILFLTG